MTQLALVTPLIVQVLITLGLFAWASMVRIQNHNGAQAHRSEKLGSEKLARLLDAYHEQFQLPVLFGLAVLVALVTGKVNGLIVILAWGFVGFRLAQTFSQITHDDVAKQFVFGAAAGALLFAMWVMLALRILFVGG